MKKKIVTTNYVTINYFQNKQKNQKIRNNFQEILVKKNA